MVRTSIADHATPNLPSRDFDVTAAFYARLGFAVSWRDANWMILERGTITLEFFPHPYLEPASSWFGCCLRFDAVMAFFEVAVAAGIPEASSGWPRLHRPRRENWGGMVGALIDPDGTLLRLIED